ncbi:MAG: 3-hydroxyacyl-CoA dehydrogenase NAD-binding domain-containing protein [Microbacterium sp.]
MSDIKTVAVLGTGVLGSQIAFQTAYSGFDVIAYDIDDKALEAAKDRFQRLVATCCRGACAARGKAERRSPG